MVRDRLNRLYRPTTPFVLDNSEGEKAIWRRLSQNVSITVVGNGAGLVLKLIQAILLTKFLRVQITIDTLSLQVRQPPIPSSLLNASKPSTHEVEQCHAGDPTHVDDHEVETEVAR